MVFVCDKLTVQAQDTDLRPEFQTKKYVTLFDESYYRMFSNG